MRTTVRASARRVEAHCETTFHDRVVNLPLRHAVSTGTRMEELFFTTAFCDTRLSEMRAERECKPRVYF